MRQNAQAKQAKLNAMATRAAHSHVAKVVGEPAPIEDIEQSANLTLFFM